MHYLVVDGHAALVLPVIIEVEVLLVLKALPLQLRHNDVMQLTATRNLYPFRS
jgi:hypothetical protein